MKKTVIFLSVIVFLASFANAQEMKDIKVMDIPSGIEYKGVIQASDTWEDKNGTNYIIISMPGEYVSKKATDQYGTDATSSYIYGYHYVKQGNSYKLLRKITDFELNCEFDLALFYVSGSLEITDLDNDGYNEVSFIYQKTCTSDLSPYDMKLMLLENGNKYPVRGQSAIDYGGGEILGGDKKFGSEFDKAPASFRNFAEKQWNKFKVTKF